MAVCVIFYVLVHVDSMPTSQSGCTKGTEIINHYIIAMSTHVCSNKNSLLMCKKNSAGFVEFIILIK